MSKLVIVRTKVMVKAAEIMEQEQNDELAEMNDGKTGLVISSL